MVVSPPTFLVPMGLLNIVLFMMMGSCSVALSVQGFDAAPLDNANGWRDHQHGSSGLSGDDSLERATTHQRYRKNKAPGIRFDMTRRPTSCAGFPMLGSEKSPSRDFACALESSSRRLKLLAGRKAGTKYIKSVTQDKASFSGETSGDSYKFPVYAGSGEFLAPIYIGTPPQKATVIIDTGSDLTWIQSQPCIVCYDQVDPIFDPSKSSTYKRLPCSSKACKDLLGTNETCTAGTDCTYSYEYGDGSETRGNFSTETITAEKTTGEKTRIALFEFGASNYNLGSFGESGGEGILGMGQGPVSMPSQLGSVFGKKFSYCLVDWLSAGFETSTMYFGDAAVPAGNVQYTPILRNANYPTYYYVRVCGISVGASRLAIDQSVFDITASGSGGSIMDSGTTITYLPPAAFDKVAEAYRSLVKYPVIIDPFGDSEWLCYNTQGITSPSFPTMVIHLDGAHWELPTANTFITLAPNATCLAFRSAGPNPFAIFGNVQQQNFDIVFELDNKRIGFVPADCAKL